MYETKYLKFGYVQDVKVILTLIYPLFKLNFDTTGLCCNKIVIKLTTQSCSSLYQYYYIMHDCINLIQTIL